MLAARGGRVGAATLVVFFAFACTEGFSGFDTSGHGKPTTRRDAGVSAGPDGAAGLVESAGGDTGSGGASAGGTSFAGTTSTGARAVDAGNDGASTDGGDNAGATSTGGTTGNDSGAGGAVGSGGAAGNSGTAGDGGSTGSGGCSATQKVCGASCVADDSPATGCASASCDACALPNVATEGCSAGACSVGTCTAPFRDCNAKGPDGCETDTSSDGANCGGCNNRCAQQGGQSCKSSLCGCTTDEQCNGGLTTSGLTCDTAAGVCHCGAQTCAHGETCARTGDCSCNAGRACAAGRTCCQTPAGCVDLTSNAASCGACGRSCPAGFQCSQSACDCRQNEGCNAGSAGTCTGGLCKCGDTTCTHGQRCLSNGKCG